MHFSVCLKYLLKPRCTTPWMPRGRIGINRQRKQKAYPCFEKIIYIFCGSFYYCDSFAYGVGVMWKISSTHYYALNPLSSFVYISLFCTISETALDSKTSTTTSTRFSQYWVLLRREPASFWRENVVAVVNLLRVLARMSKWRKQVIKCKRACNLLH